MKDFHIRYGTPSSNHFPLGCVLDWSICDISMTQVENKEEVIKWNFENENLMKDFHAKINGKLMELKYTNCNVNDCSSNHCKEELDVYFNSITNIIREAGKLTFGSTMSRKFRTIPGWNDFVRQYHEEARLSFLLWRASGSPREGDVAERMRTTRARFKLALRECRANEERHKAEGLAAKLTARHMPSFWNEVKNVKGHNCKLTNTLDGISGEHNI